MPVQPEDSSRRRTEDRRPGSGARQGAGYRGPSGAAGRKSFEGGRPVRDGGGGRPVRDNGGTNSNRRSSGSPPYGASMARTDAGRSSGRPPAGRSGYVGGAAGGRDTRSGSAGGRDARFGAAGGRDARSGSGGGRDARLGGRDGAEGRDGRAPAAGGRGRPVRAGRAGKDERSGTDDRAWGSVARRGVRALQGSEEGTSATEAWRDTVSRSRDDDGPWEPDEVWVRDDDDAPTETVVRRTGDTGPHRRNVPAPVVAELAAAAGAQRGSKLAARLADATHAYDRERYQEARRILRPLAEEVPDAAAVQELYGLVLYRSGQWALAARHLEVYRTLTGSTDQHPVLADCYRALRRYDSAEELWDELREASPGGDLVAEGRIVAAGCRADQGDLSGAIALLERSAKRVHRPQDRHLRQWYTLADLYERAGDLPRARDLFGRVNATDPDAFDVRLRLRALR
jgi:hypothetical protein